jgi:hypothetical protein
MKQIQFEKIILLIISCYFLFFIACEYKGPDAIWVEDQQGAQKPVINSIEPADSAVAGVDYIMLHGENFSTEPSENIVTFATVDNFYQVVNSSKGKILTIVQAEVKNASANTLKLYRPNILGDSCVIKVSTRYAYQFETFGSPYRVTTVSSLYVRLSAVESINAMTMDNQENLYMYMSDKTIYKITTDKERTLFSDAGVAAVVSMRPGPGGTLYISRSRNTGIYVVSPDGITEKLDDFPQKISYFDFDENGNIFAGGRESNLIIRNIDGIFKTVGDYEDFEIFGLRIFNGYVYVIAEYRGDLDSVPLMAIWKSEIVASAGDISIDVGARELVLDWAQSGDFSDSDIMDITFSAEEAGGDCFVATNNGASDTDDSTDPILIIHSDGSFESFYKGGLLVPDGGEPDADIMVWGNGKYMYIYNSAVNRIFQLGMNRNGAPYYGRGL